MIYSFNHFYKLYKLECRSEFLKRMESITVTEKND